MALRAAAASSLRAGLRLLAEQLASQAGKTAIRGVVDFGLLQAAQYAHAHQEELEKTPEGRMFSAAVTAAIAILATRDISRLMESGLVGKVLSAGREALVVLGSVAKASVSRTLGMFQAAQRAWTSMRQAGALVMVTEFGGLRVLRPRSLAEFGQAFRVAKGQIAGENLIASMERAGAPTTRASSILSRLETAAGGLARSPTAGKPTAGEIQAARAHREVAEYAVGLQGAARETFLEAVEEALNIGGRRADDLAGFVRAAVRHPNPAAYLKQVQWLSNTKISQEAFSVLGAKAGRGSVDLEWLSTRSLTRKDLDFLGRDPNTPWNLFRDASRNPGDLKLLRRAQARARGIAAEQLTDDTLSALVPGYRKDVSVGVYGRQVPMGDSVIDTAVVSTEGLGLRRGVEVKGWTSETWADSLNAYEAADAGEILVSSAERAAAARIRHMLKQLGNAAAESSNVRAVARGEGPVLVVSRAMRQADKTRLADLIRAALPDANVEIVFLTEAQITARSGRLRAAFGIP
jgi:hypothetical protein